MLETQTRDRAGSSERTRIVDATIEIAVERGYGETTIELIVDRAGLDRPAFDRHFRGKYDCFLSAWQEVNEECMETMVRAYESAESWPDRLRAVAEQVVSGLRNDPSRASFGVEVLAAGDAARARRDMTMRVVAGLIDAGRLEMDDPEAVPHTTAEALAGSAYGQIYSRVVRGTVDDLPGLVPQLMSAAVMPYLGLEAAMAELSRGPGGDDSVQEEPVSEEQERYGRGVARKKAAEKPAKPAAAADEYPPELARLPPGRHGLPREFVTHNQRERLIAGIAEAISEHGYSGTTIAHITRAAAVSRRTFYEHFESKDECFVAAYDAVMSELRERVSEAFEESDEWPQSIKAGIDAMLEFLAANPSLARLCMVEALVAGPAVVERYDAAIQSFVPYFQKGREGRSPEVLSRLSATTEEALVGGMVSLISRRIIAGKAEELEDLLPDLVEFTLTPYLGSAEASKIAKQKS
ncbi:MAG TPA: TetR/AcrR family transcriptional regulator [Solirubrobacterales bacterium]|nr:TetR/AcrR family transcriptional regulator [Solirubrobacterales bacterium]